VLRGYDLAHRWRKTEAGGWVMQQGQIRSKMPPEILFIERCMQWLKEGGRMGIVVPDGILGNPDNEPIRAWILEHARVLASIDLPVEAFLPQVGVQASLLFLQKKTRAEVNAGVDDDYPIFMAVAEHVGHDRRGASVSRRDADGFDLYEPYTVELPVLRDGQEVIEERHLRRREAADDLPPIARSYRLWRDQGVEPALV
jgi:type I restriction enzyme M protein